MALFPMILKGLGALASNLIGPLVGGDRAKSAAESSNKYNERMMREQMAAQKEFAQHGIRWKVEDAKAAGLHPLYALGSQPANYSPISVQDSVGPVMAETGQNIGRAVTASMDSFQRQMNQLQLKLLQSNIDANDAQAVLARSQAFRTLQDDNASHPIDIQGPGAGVEDEQQTEGIHILGQHTNKLAPSYIASERDDSIGANVNPMWSRYNIAPGVEIVLPGGIQGDAAEALESLGESKVLLWMTFQENKHRYGAKRAEWLMQRYGGDAWDDAKDWLDKNFNPFRSYRENFKR